MKNIELYKFVKKYYHMKLRLNSVILKNKAIEKDKLYLQAQGENERKRNQVVLADSLTNERRKYCDVIADYLNLYSKGLEFNTTKEDFNILKDYFLTKMNKVGFELIDIKIGSNLIDLDSNYYNVVDKGEEKTKVVEIIELGYKVFGQVFKPVKIKTN